MKKILLIILLVLFTGVVFGQNIFDDFVQMPLEEKVDWFFETFRDGRPARRSWFAGRIVIYHGDAVIPLLKERLAAANYFTIVTEPVDITLTLISYIWRSLHLNHGSGLHHGVPPYELCVEDIRWFFDEYLHRIDEYILAKRIIDRTVAVNSLNISSIVGRRISRHGNFVDYFDFPFWGSENVRHNGMMLKQYFSERLGVDDLVIDFTYFIE
jgi:hypothetical protein